jgi:hypothetical protein
MTIEGNPIIVDLGKKRRRSIRALKRGRGRLMDEVSRATEEVRRGLGEEAADKEIIPVVLIYQRKRKKRSGLFGW